MTLSIIHLAYRIAYVNSWSPPSGAFDYHICEHGKSGGALVHRQGDTVALNCVKTRCELDTTSFL